VEIRALDNGTCIPKNFREKLFQPFFTTEPDGEGTGLGLSFSCNIVIRALAGAITVDSVPASFIELTVTLPLRSSAGASRSHLCATPPDHRPHHATPTIWLRSRGRDPQPYADRHPDQAPKRNPSSDTAQS
jgi:hypothetical protein